MMAPVWKYLHSNRFLRLWAHIAVVLLNLQWVSNAVHTDLRRFSGGIAVAVIVLDITCALTMTLGLFACLQFMPRAEDPAWATEDDPS